MKIVTIAFIESADFKSTSDNVTMRNVTSADLNVEIPSGVDFVFMSGSSGTKTEIIKKLLSELDERGSFCELAKVEIPE